MAEVNPDAIRKLVVDLGDGSYAVRFFRAGVAEYVRVDADLYVGGANSTIPVYAKPGQQNSIWVPIVEKAYAFWRRQQGSYASINGGNGGPQDVWVDLGLPDETHVKPEPVPAAQVVTWFANGSPAGVVALSVNLAAVDWLNEIKAELEAGKAVIVGSVGGVSDSTGITTSPDNYRRSAHIYMVDSVQTDAAGNPTSITLRDPYGEYRTLTDMTRIYFCLSGFRSETVI
jgi:hypothetical protein